MQQLEDSVSRCFYEACDGVTQSLLVSCEWHVTLNAGTPTLVIHCQDQTSNWRVLNNITAIATHLAHLAKHAKIRVCPPSELGTPFEMRVDEISLY